jgi:hypothetical protein
MQPHLSVVEFVKSLTQLVCEFDYYISGSAMQKISQLKAVDRATHSSKDIPNDNIKATLLTAASSNRISYEFLVEPFVPESVDYCRVVASLCVIVSQIYKKFLEENSAIVPILKAIKAIDDKFKHFFFGSISRELNKIALEHVRQLNSYESLVKSLSEIVSSPNEDVSKREPSPIPFDSRIEKIETKTEEEEVEEIYGDDYEEEDWKV